MSTDTQRFRYAGTISMFSDVTPNPGAGYIYLVWTTLKCFGKGIKRYSAKPILTMKVRKHVLCLQIQPTSAKRIQIDTRHAEDRPDTLRGPDLRTGITV